ncbi:hypothetical protein [Glycomyces sp. NPDC021274]|uniref:hypothetical protein n=1 Tax=Glycomyces sp. NPDC021274 TaxID=3155120 RepID=UPI0033F564A3
MQTTTDRSLGILDALGYDLRISLREPPGGTRRFAVTALGAALSDTPLGEVGLTRAGLLYPALTPDAERLGFDSAAPGGALLMRVLVALAAALDTDPDLTGDPLDTIPAHERMGAAWVR